MARGTNLHRTARFPEQALWWLGSATSSGDRADWTTVPLRLLDSDTGPLRWLGNGTFGPSFQFGDTATDRDTLYVFATGAHSDGWFRTAGRRLRTGRRPPVPGTGRPAQPVEVHVVWRRIGTHSIFVRC